MAFPDDNGKITALSLGEAVITAKCGEASTTCLVKVEPTPVESVVISEHELNLIEGDTTTLTAVVKPEDATSKTVIWTSSDSDVVTVNEDGYVTAVAEGVAVIRVEVANEPTIYDECVIMVSKKINGIGNIISEGNESCEVYDQRGLKVGVSIKGLKSGIYIVRQGTTVWKLKVED